MACGGQKRPGWLTRGSRAWLFPARTIGHQLALDRGRNPGSSYHCSSCGPKGDDELGEK